MAPLKDDQTSDSSLHVAGMFLLSREGTFAACPVLQRKNQRKAQSASKSVAFVCTHSSDSLVSIDPSFEPFVCKGAVSFTELWVYYMGELY